MDTAVPLLPLLVDQLEPLRLLCDRYGVDRLEVFGSAVKGLFDPASSDLDFIVQMTGQQEPGYARRFCGFADELEALWLSGGSLDGIHDQQSLFPQRRGRISPASPGTLTCHRVD